MQMNKIISNKDNDKLYLYSKRIVMDNKTILVYIDKDDCIVTDDKYKGPYDNIESIRSVTNYYKSNVVIGKILVSSGVILIINSKILLMKRDKDAKYDPMKWSMPAGRCDRDPTTTALKEFYEEVMFYNNKGNGIILIPNKISRNHRELYQTYRKTLMNNNIKGIKTKLVMSECLEWESSKVIALVNFKKREIIKDKMWHYFDESSNTIELRKVYWIRNIEENNFFFRDAEFNREMKLMDLSKLYTLHEGECVAALNAFIKSIKLNEVSLLGHS